MREDVPSGQVWSCVQYPTSPYFQAMPTRNGACYPIPAPVEWNANLIIARECIREATTKRSSLRYIKPMIARCVVVDWTRYWVLKPEDRKNYLRKGVATKKELMDIIERYESNFIHR